MLQTLSHTVNILSVGDKKIAKVNHCKGHIQMHAIFNDCSLLLLKKEGRKSWNLNKKFTFFHLWFPFICIWINLYDANIPRVTLLDCYVEIWFHVMLHVHASVCSWWVITLGNTILAVIWFRNANSKQTCSEYRNQMEFLQLVLQNLFMIFT